jgi:cytochrome c-type biogenesis protein CcmH
MIYIHKSFSDERSSVREPSSSRRPAGWVVEPAGRPEDDYREGRFARRIKIALAPLAALLLIAAASNDPADRLPDPAQETRARSLFRDIRCLVCQNQSIDESDADLAEDLRKIVRQQVAAGRTDAQIKRYLTDRYGEFVLERPAFSLGNGLLWGAPFAVVIVGGALLLLGRREGQDKSLQDEPPLSAEEEAKLTKISSDLS